MTTFKANMTGKALFANDVPEFVVSWPSIRATDFQPDRTYSVVAPEAILWTVKPIRKFWTEMVAGPDILKSEITQAIYGTGE